jgi:CRP/FNR family transcriptional regulator
LAEINRLSTRRRITAGSTIVHEAEPSDWCAIIVSGIVKLVKATTDGREQIVAIQFPSEFIGQPFDEPSRLRAEAVTAVELCCFPRAALDQISAQYPGLSRALLVDTTHALDAAREWMLVLGGKTAEEKVASFLLLIAERSGGEGCAGEKDFDRIFEVPLSRTEMGQFLGLRIETVSRQMKALKADKVIQTIGGRRVRILNPEKLRWLAEHETS